VTEETEVPPTVDNTTSAATAKDHANEVAGGVERITRKFNRYLYLNLTSNVELQIEYWMRKADRQANPAAGQALLFKAEGLGYALRLLNAFEPEFQELVDCASCTTTDS
jgi:hypothetical protein